MNDVNFQIVDVENELSKRRNDQQPESIPTAARSKIGCLSVIVWFVLGILIFRLIAALLNI